MNSSRHPSLLSSRYFTVNISEYFTLIKHVSIFVVLSSHIIVSDSLRPHGLQPTRRLCPWEFSRQAYWNGLPFFSPESLPSLEIEPASPASLLHCRWTLTTEPLNYYFFLVVKNEFTYCTKKDTPTPTIYLLLIIFIHFKNQVYHTLVACSDLS